MPITADFPRVEIHVDSGVFDLVIRPRSITRNIVNPYNVPVTHSALVLEFDDPIVCERLKFWKNHNHVSVRKHVAKAIMYARYRNRMEIIGEIHCLRPERVDMTTIFSCHGARHQCVASFRFDAIVENDSWPRTQQKVSQEIENGDSSFITA